MTEYEQRLRTAILKQVAEDRRKFEPEVPEDEMDAIVAVTFEGLNRHSAQEFQDVSGEGTQERVYRLNATDYDGLGFDVFTVVDTFDRPSDNALITRIKTIFAFIEGATAVIYSAEYGEEGIDFDVPGFVAVSTTPPPLAPADQIREAFARAAEQYKRGEMTVFELDTVLDLIVPRH